MLEVAPRILARVTDEAAGALRQAALLRGMLPGGPPARGQVE